jgi:hypothetical protein
MDGGGVFDWMALLRAVCMGLVVSLIANVIMHSLGTKRRAMRIQLGLAAGLLTLVIVFAAWPSTVNVPELKGLAQASAEDAISRKGLVPQARPQYFEGEKPGCVIPGSQQPLAGLAVRKGTVVTFSVAQNNGGSQGGQNPDGKVQLSFFSPSSSQKAVCKRDASGIYRLAVSGTVAGLDNSMLILLWARPVNPPSDQPGWYLQRAPVNGITGISPSGTWNGLVQIGNEQYPPHPGDIYSVMVAVCSAQEASALLARQGVVNLVNVPGFASAEASNIILDPK